MYEYIYGNFQQKSSKYNFELNKMYSKGSKVRRKYRKNFYNLNI